MHLLFRLIEASGIFIYVNVSSAVFSFPPTFSHQLKGDERARKDGMRDTRDKWREKRYRYERRETGYRDLSSPTAKFFQFESTVFYCEVLQQCDPYYHFSCTVYMYGYIEPLRSIDESECCVPLLNQKYAIRGEIRMWFTIKKSEWWVPLMNQNALFQWYIRLRSFDESETLRSNDKSDPTAPFH